MFIVKQKFGVDMSCNTTANYFMRNTLWWDILNYKEVVEGCEVCVINLMFGVGETIDRIF